MVLRTYVLLLQALIDIQMYEKADDNFKRAIELEPDSGNIYVHRGYVCCIVKLCSSFTSMWSLAIIVSGVFCCWPDGLELPAGQPTRH